MPRISPWPALFFFALMAGMVWLARSMPRGTPGVETLPGEPLVLEPSFPAVSHDLDSHDMEEVNALMRQKVQETYGR